MCTPEAALLDGLWVRNTQMDHRRIVKYRISTRTKHILKQVPSCGPIHMTFELNICRYLAHHELESVAITLIILMIIEVVIILIKVIINTIIITIIIIIIIIFIIVIIIIIICRSWSGLCWGRWGANAAACGGGLGERRAQQPAAMEHSLVGSGAVAALLLRTGR